MDEKEIAKRIEELRAKPFPPLGTILPGESTAEGEEVEGLEGAYFFSVDDKLRPLAINLHGGGYVKGRTERDSLYSRYIMNNADVNVLDLDYPLAPEHPFPEAMEYCFNVYKEVLENPEKFGCDGRVALVGHSAGAVLSLDVTFLAEERGLKKPLGIILDYPPVNMKEDPMIRLSEEEKKDERIVARTETEQLYTQLYTVNDDPANPYISPLFMPKERLEALPETMIVVGQQDKLHDNAKAFSEKAGCQFVSYPETNHGFTTNRNGEWQKALDCHTDFLKKIFQ